MKKIILFVLISVSLFAQKEDEKILARVGNKNITLKEFRERYELTPQLGRHNKNREEYLKEELLYSIIAEKLWALESEKLQLDTIDVMKYTFPALQKMYWRDALYSEEVKSKAVISAEDYKIARQRSAWNLLTKYLYAESKREIDSLYNILQNGFPFDSLLVQRPEFSLQTQPYVVSFGRMEKFVEDTLYNLKVGDYSVPLKSPEGWYIFKVESIEQNLITNEKQAKALEKNIRQVVEARATDKSFREFANKFFENMNVNADGEVFWSFSNIIIKHLQKRKSESNIKDGENVALTDEDFNSILKEIPADTLNMTFIKFDKNPVTLKTFLHEFFFEGFYSNNLEPNVIRAKLNSRVRIFIEKELLAREAYKRNLHTSEEVKHFTDMWRDNYLSTLYRNSLMKDVTVSNDEVVEKYNNQNNSSNLTMQVNIIELLTDSLEVIEDVLNRISAGEDFKQLAAKHTKRAWTKNTGGEFGFFPVNAYGEIGRIASQMEIGETYGPLKTDDGYSLFKLIDKKEAVIENPKPFDEVKNELKKQIKLDKASEKLINRTAELANKYGVKVDEDLLRSVKPSNLAMVVYRYMGFGGRILAVPYSSPFIQWVQKWKQENKLP